MTLVIPSRTMMVVKISLIPGRMRTRPGTDLFPSRDIWTGGITTEEVVSAIDDGIVVVLCCGKGIRNR